MPWAFYSKEELMKQFARTASAVLVLCLLLPACTLDSTDEGTNSPAADTPMLLTPDMKYHNAMAVVNSAPRYGGPGLESEGVVYFDAETFYREWEAWKALGLTDYTFRFYGYGYGSCNLKEDVKAAGNSAIATVRYWDGTRAYDYDTSKYITRPGNTVDQLFEDIERQNKNNLEAVQNREPGQKGKYSIEISYDPQYHYPILTVMLTADYIPHCSETWWYLDHNAEVFTPFCSVCKVKAEQGDRNYQWFPAYGGWEITSFQPD
jgi:hypothetical protein